MTVQSIVEERPRSGFEIVVVSDGDSGPLEDLLVSSFEGTWIDVDRDRGLESDQVAALDAESQKRLSEGDSLAVLLRDGDPVAATALGDLYETVLAINSDLFKTGTKGFEDYSLPDVVAGLEGARLRLRGYPLAHKEKLLLIMVSRYIEGRAWEHGAGRLRSSFQTLSRLEDEVGTYRVYDRLAGSDVDVHVYGRDDGVRPDLDVGIHVGDGPDYRDSWFVVFCPEDEGAAALVCHEVDPRIWDGFFTFDTEAVRDIETRIATEL